MTNGNLLAVLAVVGITSICACARPASSRCADGTICPAGLQCMEGRCISSNCGNGIPDTGEVCDDGNNISGDGCNSECSSDERCGNAIFDPNEDCDCGDGDTDITSPLGCNDTPNDDERGLCTTRCTFHCGDRVINSEEDCDTAPPEGLYCVDYGYDTGLLECSDFCKIVGGDNCLFFGWQRLPASTRANLRAIWGTDRNNIYVVGWSGTISRFDGRQWTDVSGDTWQATFYAIWGRGADDIYVAGDDGLVLHYDGEQWDEWQDLEIPGDTSATSTDINGIWGPSGTTRLVAVGDSGRVWFVDGGAKVLNFTWMKNATPIDLHAVWGTSIDNIYAVGDDFSLLHYNGSTWSEVDTGLSIPSTSDDTEDDFNAVWGTTPDNVFVVGDQGTVWHFDGQRWSKPLLPAMYADTAFRAVWGTSKNSVFIGGEDGATMHFDGEHWIGLRATISDHLYAFWGTSASDLYAVGNNGAIARHNGIAWAELGPLTNSSGLPLQEELTSVWGTSAQNIYAAGIGGLVLHYDGKAWTPLQPLGITQDFRAIWGTDSGDVIYIVGDNGTIVRYAGGEWWNMTIAALGTKDFLSVWGFAANDVHAVGDDGIVYHFDGESWKPYNGVPTARDLRSVWGAAPDDIHALSAPDAAQGLGSEILHYDGASWSVDPLQVNDDLNRVWGTTRDDVYIVGNDGVLLQRTNLGEWALGDPQTAQDLHAIGGNSSGERFAAGSNGAVMYHDGQNWQPVRTSTFARINAVWAADKILVLVGKEGVLEMLVRTDR